MKLNDKRTSAANVLPTATAAVVGTDVILAEWVPAVLLATVAELVL
jgi:hypothetical protein